MNPDEDRNLLAALRRPDVQVLAVFALLLEDMDAPVIGKGVDFHSVHGNGAVPVCILDAFPGLDFLGQMEAFCMRIGHAHENVDIAVADAAKFSIGRLDDGSFPFKYKLVHKDLLFVSYCTDWIILDLFLSRFQESDFQFQISVV